MNRTIWRQPLASTYAPPFPCPNCSLGHLGLVPKSLIGHETAKSKGAHSDEDWDPDWITYVFTAWLRCNKCGQQCAVSGKGGVEMDYDHETGEGDYSDYYTPSALIPMPDVFSIPPRCPDDVTEALRASFSCMWADPSAAANHLRSSLERLLDHLGVKRRSKATSGKVESLSLHARILLFEKTQPAIGRSLMALKWAGNSGSHGRSVSIDDLLDGYEILEHALQEIVEERSKRVAALAKKLSKKHAPKQR